MMPNFIVLAATALIPLLVGAIWYNPKIGFGHAWMKAANMSPNAVQGANMALVFGLTYLFSFFAAAALYSIVIHQAGFVSLMQGYEGPESTQAVSDFLAAYGDRFRTFKHGALHGTIAGITLALPILGVNALFERKGFKYVAINVGYWIVSLALMGGVICQWGSKVVL